jgi:hypothetical protein
MDELYVTDESFYSSITSLLYFVTDFKERLEKERLWISEERKAFCERFLKSALLYTSNSIIKPEKSCRGTAFLKRIDETQGFMVRQACGNLKSCVTKKNLNITFDNVQRVLPIRKFPRRDFVEEIIVAGTEDYLSECEGRKNLYGSWVPGRAIYVPINYHDNRLGVIYCHADSQKLALGLTERCKLLLLAPIIGLIFNMEL